MAAPSVLEKKLTEIYQTITYITRDLNAKGGGYPHVIGMQVKEILVKNGYC